MTRLVCAAALGALAGCGLIDSDIADVDLSLPPKEFTVDTAEWDLQAEGDTFPAVDCSEMAGICSAAAQGVCGGGDTTTEQTAECFARCNDMDACEATVLITLFTDVDLEMEKPELAKIEGQPVVDVTIEKIWYDINENTMNIASPALTVYVAPMGVMRGGDPLARPAIGEIPSVPAGMTLQDGQLEISEDGQERLKMFMADFKTPFNIIIEATVEVRPGDAVPMGLLRAEFNARATAGL